MTWPNGRGFPKGYCVPHNAPHHLSLFSVRGAKWIAYGLYEELHKDYIVYGGEEVKVLPWSKEKLSSVP